MRLNFLVIFAVISPVIYCSDSNESPGLLDSFRDLLNWSKDKLIDTPQEITSQIVSRICSSGLENIISPSYTPNLELVECQLQHPGRNVSFHLTSPHNVLPKLKHDMQLTVFITGYNSNAKTIRDAFRSLKNAYQCRGESLLIVEVSQHLESIRSWLHFDVEPVGRAVGEMLHAITTVVPKENIHLIGHSVGAHVAGVAGRRYYQLSGQKLPRITGLDPSLLCHRDREGRKLVKPGDAQFVDMIHTNVGILGINRSIGDVDFYPNGHGTLEPGCHNVVCSHHRAMSYFAETVVPGNEENFLAVKCDSLANLDKCSHHEQIPMGYQTPSEARGEFYLRTRSESPFGWNADASNINKCN